MAIILEPVAPLPGPAPAPAALQRFSEDLTPFFLEFGDLGTLDGVAVRGIYDEPSGVDLGGITATQPQLTLPSHQVPASVFETLLVIPQGTFRVRDALPDGTGVTVLTLTRT